MGSFYMEATQINYRRDETFKTVDQKLQELSETSAIDTDIAPVFKSTNTYAPGDMVYYRNKLYVFNVEHTGAWAAGDVTATDVTTEISSLKSGLTNMQNRRYAYNISTDDLQLETNYTVDLPNGYDRLNTIITGINIYKYSSVYSEKYLTQDTDLDCTVMINSDNKLLYHLKGSSTVGGNTYLRVMIERID